MIDNAVAYFEDLVNVQEVEPSNAFDHVQQRYGIDRLTLEKRLDGKVAQHTATMEALADVKAYLTGDVELEDFDQLDTMIRVLYNAVTGENR